MRINFGCGRRVLPGYYNIDAVHSPKALRPPELIYEIRFNPDGSVAAPVPLDDGCADELFAAHVIEHVHEWEHPFLLLEWKRLLRIGGKLILELPNIEAAARNMLAGMDVNMWRYPFYGDGSHRDPYMIHKFGFTPKSIKAAVVEAGFTDVSILPPLTHGPRPNRDMRVEAIKP